MFSFIKKSAALIVVFGSSIYGSNYIGEYNDNPYDSNSVSNPYGRYGSPYSSDSVNNPYGQYGSRYSNKSANNPYANDAPKLYDQNGNYRGKLSANRYDPDSTSNPYGRYGSKYSPDSINNPYGAGSHLLLRFQRMPLTYFRSNTYRRNGYFRMLYLNKRGIFLS